MQELLLIGIGTGDPGHLTAKAHDAIAAADLILIPDKGADKADLAELRQALIAGIRPDADSCTALFQMPVRDPALPYHKRVEAWHDQIAEAWVQTIADHPKARRVALLVWGDPSLYDSTLRIAGRLSPAPKITVIPGLTSLQLLTAAHAIPLNTVGGAVVLTTGRQLRDHGWPEGAESVAVMLDGSCAFQTLPPEDLHIWWGACLGMAEEELAAGLLAKVGPQILAQRAALKARHGWVMDIYLLRKV